MADFTTSQNRSVEHCHLGETPECSAVDFRQTRVDFIRDFLKRLHPNASETGPPTHTYNCVGYALARSHGWFNRPENFFTDDYVEASFDSPAEGDVVVYHTILGAFAHVGVVTRVSNGRIVRVRSKWASMSELAHALEDVFEPYGKPAVLLRPRPGVVPFVLPLDVEGELPEPVVVAPLASLEGGLEMPEPESVDEVMRRALDSISTPEVYIRVALASTPEMARYIIETLPGVKELIDIGPAAVPALLRLLERAEAEEEPQLAGVALYILQRIPEEEAVRPLAKAIDEGKFTGLNLHLAADALLSSAKTPVVNESPVKAALREAEKINNPE